MGQKGTMSALRRTSAGLYTEADAHTLEAVSYTHLDVYKRQLREKREQNI